MSANRPGTIALRAVNQYRQRDVFTYLALRYYLDNSAARTDQWAQKFAVESVLKRSTSPYSSVLHFKEMECGQPTHREMNFPGAGEALAEAALIDACSSASGAGFSMSPHVYSYNPVARGNSSGVFDHYMVGFRRRHEAITSACKQGSGKIVAFMDIKKFYPSITIESADRAWRSACEGSDVSKTFRELGFKIIHDHAMHCVAAGGKTASILTGPMFSHLIGNLLLSKVDGVLANSGVGYCRYVDDIALIGTPERVRQSRIVIESMLHDMGLELHDEAAGKSLEISATDWLQGAEDDDEWQKEDSWMRLVADIKRLLVHRPDSANDVGIRFAAHNFRIPILDYSAAAHESGYAHRFVRSFSSFKYFGVSTSAAIDSLVERAGKLKRRYAQELMQFNEEYLGSEGFQAKRLIPKIRYRLGRLAYLSDQGELKSMSEDITDPTLALHGEVVKAIATGCVDRVLEMGRNVAQAVAQPIGMAQNRVVVEKLILTDEELQALAVFRVNGVEVQISQSANGESELMRFAENGADLKMMQSNDPFVSQLASLHGLFPSARHSEVLDTPFDPLEEIALDALDPAGGSL
ncbi:reverse transcriptase [compost metagenome]